MADSTPDTGPDLSQAVTGPTAAEGGELVPSGTHADGTLCFHGIDAELDGQWAQCRDGQQVLLSGIARPGDESWVLVPTPCPDCGAKDEVQVRQAIVTAGEDGAEPDGGEGWEYRCQVCGSHGPAQPRAAGMQ